MKRAIFLTDEGILVTSKKVADVSFACTIMIRPVYKVRFSTGAGPN